ncbi:MAG: sodium:calcium antiporter [Solirubrobacterales bacterium]
MGFLLLLVAFAVILGGALAFTNAVEWLGNKLSIGEGAVGSLLAAVGTAMPETLIPIVAVIGGSAGAEDVAIGAIVGAPFLLATLAMLLVGVASHTYQGRRDQGKELEPHDETVSRDIVLFLAFGTVGLLLGLGAPRWLHYAFVPVMLIAYGLYVRATLKSGGDTQEQETINPLYLHRSAGDDPSMIRVLIQFIAALAAIFVGAQLFVTELEEVAKSLGLEVIVLSLILAPLATELPEKINSFIWTREGKDSLAMGNITGAMVFQTMIPVAFGLAATDWDLDRYAILSIILGLGGGAVALYALRRRGRFTRGAMLAWISLYGVFVAYVLLA